MAAQEAEGIILRKYYLRETSYILVILTKEFGKIKGVIKGVRNPYPQFAGNFEIFTQCRLLFYRKKKKPLDLITQCEAISFFLPVRKDIEKLTYANYFIELVDIVTSDYGADEGLYQALVEGLCMLETGASAKRVARIFELKLLDALGLSPALEKCVLCGIVISETSFFSVSNGGLLCGKCRLSDRESLAISLGTAKFMRKIQLSEAARTFNLKVVKEVGRETEEVLRRFLQYHITRPVKSLGFLRQLEKTGII